MKKILISLAVATSLIAFSGCGRSAAKEPTAARPLQLKTAQAEIRKVSDVIDLPARIQPDPAAVVRVFPPAGGRLARVSVIPGDFVSRGQVVAVLESSDVSQARSDLTKAQAEFDRSEHALIRSKSLLDHGVVSEREYEDAQAQEIEARSELDRAKARLRVLGASESGSDNDVSVRSPIAGTVLDISSTSGELSKSTDNANPICTIANLSSVWLTGDAYEKDLEVVRPGVPVEVTVVAYPDRRWQGKIANVSDAIDPQTRTAKVRVVLANPKRELKPEMFASLKIVKPATEALVIPSSAVLHEGGDNSVMVKSSNDNYERRLVSVRRVSGSEVEVLSGLKPGETVVTEGAALLRGAGEE